MDLCGMEINTNSKGNVEWVIHSGLTETEYTGPLGAYSKDKYIYMDGDSGQKEHDKAL